LTRRCLLRVLAATVALAVAPGRVAADDDVPESVRAAREILAADVWQKELPGVDVSAEEPAPREERRFSRGSGGSPAGAVTRGFFEILLIGAGCAVIALIVVEVFARARFGRGGTLAPGDAVAAGAGAAATDLRIDLHEVEALASRGQFAQAVHLLLVRVLSELVAKRGVSLSPAWTSRDVVRRVALPPDPAAALEALVAAVEISLFGGRAVTEEDYRRSRHAYDRLVAAGSGS